MITIGAMGLPAPCRDNCANIKKGHIANRNTNLYHSWNESHIIIRLKLRFSTQFNVIDTPLNKGKNHLDPLSMDVWTLRDDPGPIEATAGQRILNWGYQVSCF